ncbi:Protein TonB [Paramagnetospirillum caucaseum]|uniref:Protein TonB n=1 Tax=Paramagnetospirillum caucaseum TaxID=1244869 RepID=M2YDK5_9PROT|nr:TonB family protein [Paramagnetospirillum caucaseum]EME71051.1 Protein TonB [Paramagnetospirillum caucaseum]
MSTVPAAQPEVRPILLSAPLVAAAHAALLWAAMGWTAPLPVAVPAPSFAIDLEAAAVPTPPQPPQPQAEPPQARAEPPPPLPRPVRKSAAKPAAAAPSVPAAESAQAAEPVAVQAQTETTTAATPPSAAPSVPAVPQAELARWQGVLLAHLERHKRYPRDAWMRRQEGAATIRFVMDSSGRVLSAVLERGSGVESLDHEGLALIERAQPLPRPPGGSGDRIDLAVPVRFQLR